MRGQATESAPGTIRFERYMPGPVTRIWDYLTHPTIRGQWLGTGPMDQREGGRFEITFRHDELTPHAEIAPEKVDSAKAVTLRGEVTDCRFPSVLSLTWPAGGPASSVTFVLTQIQGQVLVALTQSGIKDRQTQIELASRWHAHLNILEAKANSILPPPFWKRFVEYEAHYGQLFTAEVKA